MPRQITFVAPALGEGGSHPYRDSNPTVDCRESFETGYWEGFYLARPPMRISHIA